MYQAKVGFTFSVLPVWKWCNVRFGRISKLFAPGYGSCLRCHTPWKFVHPHQTKYTETRSMFPLCEKCWKGLKTPGKRLPYYYKLFQIWKDKGCYDPEHMNGMEEAVLKGY